MANWMSATSKCVGVKPSPASTEFEIGTNLKEKSKRRRVIGRISLKSAGRFVPGSKVTSAESQTSASVPLLVPGAPKWTSCVTMAGL